MKSFNNAFHNISPSSQVNGFLLSIDRRNEKTFFQESPPQDPESILTKQKYIEKIYIIHPSSILIQSLRMLLLHNNLGIASSPETPPSISCRNHLLPVLFQLLHFFHSYEEALSQVLGLTPMKQQLHEHAPQKTSLPYLFAHVTTMKMENPREDACKQKIFFRNLL